MVEILEFKLKGDWYQVRVAIDGQVAPRFDIPKSYRYEEFPKDDQFEAFLARQARALLEEYGDQRHEVLL